jgi:hypothetical protein
MGDSFQIDTRNLEDFEHRLRTAADRWVIEKDLLIAELTKDIAETAKGIAAQHSKSIPGTIRSHIEKPGMGIIEAGNTSVPIAALYEMGNRKSKKSKETFRHPVFGNRNIWVEQSKHPYLRPAMLLWSRVQAKRVREMNKRALEPYHLKPE